MTDESDGDGNGNGSVDSEPSDGADESADRPSDDSPDHSAIEDTEAAASGDDPGRPERGSDPDPVGYLDETDPAEFAKSGTTGDESDAEGTETSEGEPDGSDADEAEPGAEDTDADGAEPNGTDDRPKAQTDGEGYVGGPADRTEPTYPDPDDADVGGISTPPGDEEMPLADHIEEMVLRLAVVLLVGSAATAIGLLWATDAINLIWNNVFPASGEDIPRPHVYHPLELWLTRIKVAALLGIIVALPMFVYQCYLFMRPGLYPHERKYYLAAVPTSVVLGAVGMVFSFLLVLPALFSYFTYYSEASADVAYGLGETFNLIITLTGFLAVVFQIPLFIMLAIMMGVTTRRWLAEKRLYFWAAFAVLAFTFTIDPTLMAAILVAITMIALFEGTLALLKWTGRE